MRAFIVIGLLGLLAACSTWEGFKDDLVKGVEVVEDAI